MIIFLIEAFLRMIALQIAQALQCRLRNASMWDPMPLILIAILNIKWLPVHAWRNWTHQIKGLLVLHNLHLIFIGPNSIYTWNFVVLLSLLHCQSGSHEMLQKPSRSQHSVPLKGIGSTILIHLQFTGPEAVKFFPPRKLNFNKGLGEAQIRCSSNWQCQKILIKSCNPKEHSEQNSASSKADTTPKRRKENRCSRIANSCLAYTI